MSEKLTTKVEILQAPGFYSRCSVLHPITVKTFGAYKGGSPSHLRRLGNSHPLAFSACIEPISGKLGVFLDFFGHFVILLKKEIL